MPLINKTLINAAGEVRSQDFEQLKNVDIHKTGIHKTGTFMFPEFTTVGITDGLVGYWQLDKDVRDYSGNNYNGTVVGALPYGEFYKFDGIDDYINIPHQVLTTQQIRESGLTMIAKVRPTEIKESRIFSMKPTTGYSDSATGGIGIRESGTARIICYDDPTSYKYVNSSTVLSVNEWYLVIGIYNPADATMRLYLNGIEEGTPQVITTYSRLSSNDETYIGNDSTQSREFAGDIAYVKIFNRALTAKEVKLEYNTMFNNEVQVEKVTKTLFAKDLINFEEEE